MKKDVQVFDFGGNEELQNFIATLKKMEGFDQIRSMLILRDAEKDASQAQRDVCTVLKAETLPIPDSACSWKQDKIRVAYAFFPNCAENPENGTLEDLCLDILSEKNKTILGKIDGFIEKLKEECNREFPHEFKTKLHTYFSVTDKYISLKIGEAAKAGAFSWDDKKLLPLKWCIENMDRT